MSLQKQIATEIINRRQLQRENEQTPPTFDEKTIFYRSVFSIFSNETFLHQKNFC